MITVFKQTWHELFRERTRMVLTILAIAWGTFTITTVLAIGEGLRINFANTMANSGSNLLTLTGVSTSKAYQGTPQNTVIRLTKKDFEAIKEAIPNVVKISPQYSSQKKIIYQDKSDSANILGVDDNYGEIHQIPTQGRFISSMDINERRAVIVLGTETKKQLFPKEDSPIEKIIYINHQPFRIIGLMKEKPQMIAEQIDRKSVV